MNHVWRWGWCGVVVTVLGAVPTEGVGQEQVLPPPALVLAIGGFSYDHEEGGNWTGTVIGLRVDFPLSGIFTLEPGVDRVTWTGDEDGAPTRALWTVDFAMHAEYRFDRIAPYAGGNLGAVLDFADDRDLSEDFIDAAYGGHGGIRFDVTPRLALRGEVRARWIDNFESRLLLYTGGVSWRF